MMAPELQLEVNDIKLPKGPSVCMLKFCTGLGLSFIEVFYLHIAKAANWLGQVPPILNSKLKLADITFGVTIISSCRTERVVFILLRAFLHFLDISYHY
jgi:hypothetical protein